MKKQLLFIQGGGDDGYNEDKAMVASLKPALGDSYEVIYPELESDESVSDFGWPRQIADKINDSKGHLILAGHSLGASSILKCLSETKITKTISGIFLLAPPFWRGNEDWKKGLILKDDFAGKLPGNTPVFLYQCKDDEVVPFEHFTLYTQKLPHATAHVIDKGGHQFNDDLRFMTVDIKKL
jgi:uncharacterized protein